MFWVPLIGVRTPVPVARTRGAISLSKGNKMEKLRASKHYVYGVFSSTFAPIQRIFLGSSKSASTFTPTSSSEASSVLNSLYKRFIVLRSNPSKSMKLFILITLKCLSKAEYKFTKRRISIDPCKNLFGGPEKSDFSCTSISNARNATNTSTEDMANNISYETISDFSLDMFRNRRLESSIVNETNLYSLAIFLARLMAFFLVVSAAKSLKARVNRR